MPGRLAQTGLVAITGVVLVLLYGPILLPILSSFFEVHQGRIDWSAPSFSAYASLARNDGILAAMENTLIVGVSAVVLSLTLGTLLAFYYASGRSLDREILQFVIFLPFLMPPIITGLSLLVFFREINFERSLLTVVIGHTVFVLAIAYRSILVRLQSLSTSMIEAAYDLGASRFLTFRRIVLPHLASAIIGAAALSFALSFDETLITILVTGTDNTLPMRLWAMMRLGFTPDINALVALVLLLTTALCLLATRQIVSSDDDSL